MKKTHKMQSIIMAAAMAVFCLARLFTGEEGRKGRVIEELAPISMFKGDISLRNSFSFENGRARLDVPEGSVPESKSKMRVAELTAQKVKLDYGKKRFTALGPSYQFGPAGLKFNKEVDLTLPYENPEGFPDDYINLYYYGSSRS